MKAALVLVMLTCGTAESKGTEAFPAAKGTTNACHAQALELDAFMHAMDTTPRLIYDTEAATLQLLERSDATQIIDALTVKIGAKETTYLGKVVTPKALHDLLAKDKPTKYPIGILIDQTVPWARVVITLDAIDSADITSVAFGFAQPLRVTPQAAKGKEPDDTCAAYTAVLDRASSIHDDHPAFVKALVDGLGPAVDACNCNIDAHYRMREMWWLLGNPHPVRGIAVKLEHKSPLVLDPTTPWKTAGTRITTATTSFATK